MKPHRNQSAQLVFARLVTASVLALAGAHLVQAQQPAATQDSTTTRAAKKAELKKLEQNGYQPTANDPHYPQDIQNAEKKTNGTAAPGAPNAVGQSPN
ncbi:DUF4148 domain-containing protein [Paraburkholderia sp. BCC1884]|uniref:DUF4148 domain-containing protein n=1 Tax=Paraburkholderia sp. BCC1884 TaxID=2562668 RepID=UPI0021B3CDB3|nr:DUF4148 domain-containing protein [Paraburkholderia sp. BCC1884]